MGVAAGLVCGRKGVNGGELRPGDRRHLAGGVELHGARAQRNHGAVERDVLVGQTAQVAQHFSLAAIAMEHRMGEECADSGQLLRPARRHTLFGGGKQRLILRHAEAGQDVGQIAAGHGFVQRHRDMLRADAAEVDAPLQRSSMHLFSARAGVHRQGVEELGVEHRQADLLQPLRQQYGVGMHPLGDALEALGAVIHRVHAGQHGGQHLRGADIARGFFAADVLLPGLQRQAISRLSVRVLAHADEAAGHRALERVAHRQITGMRAAQPQRQTETLGGAAGDVGPEFARRHQQGERQEIGRHHDQHAFGLERGDAFAVVAHGAVHARVLQQHAEILTFQRLVHRAGNDLDVQRRGAGVQHFEGLRQHIVSDEKALRFGGRLARTQRQGHGLGGGGGLVEHGGVGNIHAGEIGHQGLEVEQRLQPPLADLRLIRRVRGVPGRVLQHIALNDAGHQGVVVALADIAAHHPVAAGDAPQLAQRLSLVDGRRQIERLLATDGCRDHHAHQTRQIFSAQRRQHVLLLCRIGADVTALEGLRIFKIAQRGLGGHQHAYLRKGRCVQAFLSSSA